MAKTAARSGNDGPFDLDKLRELLEMMEKHDLTEISLKRGDEKWKLRRGPMELTQVVPSAPAAYALGLPAAAPAPVSGEAAPAADAATSGLLEITSPTVGTFYVAPSPEDPPFVTVGGNVQPDTVVCVVEAMKVFNQIPSEVSGTITEVLVGNGDAVEFGQPLFKVRPG